MVFVFFVARAWARAREPLTADRYNGPWPSSTVRTPLQTRIERLSQEVAVRGGRTPPEVDPRLEAAASSLLRYVPEGAPPPNDLVEEALRLQGIVEPSPHLVVVSLVEGGEASVVSELDA